MKFSLVNFDKWTRKPFRFNVKYPYNIYKYAKPVYLKNFVSGKEVNKKTIPCLMELTNILECLKDNDMDDRKCTKQINLHVDCQDKVSWKKSSQNVTKSNSAGWLSSSDLNKLMKRYPLPHKMCLGWGKINRRSILIFSNLISLYMSSAYELKDILSKSLFEASKGVPPCNLPKRCNCCTCFLKKHAYISISPLQVAITNDVGERGIHRVMLLRDRT
ncbi:hypothetical protein A3Q56_03567 [Intoshia linei]|uniref:Uncharacterized protein n=1 Tax=Intoshia linei TaxID=1819745 RepID=A0A177B335_9BILA|nr:hypothetical protein A3Q56_03567 [Intoshia linei]